RLALRVSTDLERCAPFLGRATGRVALSDASYFILTSHLEPSSFRDGLCCLIGLAFLPDTLDECRVDYAIDEVGMIEHFPVEWNGGSNPFYLEFGQCSPHTCKSLRACGLPDQ